MYKYMNEIVIFDCTLYLLFTVYRTLLQADIIGIWKKLITKSYMKMTTTIGDVRTLQTLTSHTSDVTSIDFASDCVLVTGSG